MKQTTKDYRCSLWDMGITNVTIKQTNFEILSAPKRGGSCLVYEALKKEKIGQKEFQHRVILKEFYPVLAAEDAMGVKRKKNGFLCVSENILHSSNYKKRLNKFLDSYEIMIELSKQSESTDHSVTVLSLSEANGTWYIEEAYDSGKLIFDYETPPTLNEFLTTMKNCLLVLKNLHQLGYYHLDLKPDNISLTKSGVIKFWDIDSLVKISELGTCQDFLWSDGFSAPEIESASRRPADAPYLIGPWTDIYSVAQLFCYYCFKRPLRYVELIHELPELIKHIPRADFYITRDHYMGEYLYEEKAHPLFSKNAIYLLKHFLLRALSFRQSERYQTIEDALEDLTVIIEQCDAKKIQPVDNFSGLTSEEFSSFDQFEKLELLEDFFASKDNENYFATITGGSSEDRLELAEYYATTHRLDYDTIIEVHSNNIANALHLFFFYGQEPARFNSQHILIDLKQYCRDHKLLIIVDDTLADSSFLADDDEDYEILNELLKFQDTPPHFLHLSDKNRLGSYITVENEQRVFRPFFELRLPDNSPDLLTSSNPQDRKKNSLKRISTAVILGILGIFFAEAPDYFITNVLTETTVSSWYRSLICLTALGPLFCTGATVYYYIFLTERHNPQYLTKLANGYRRIFLANLAVTSALTVSRYVSVVSLSMLGVRYGIPNVNNIDQFVMIPKYILYALLLGLLLGIPFLWHITSKSFKALQIAEKSLCIGSVIFSFIYLLFHTFQMRWVLAIYIILWIAAWFFLRRSEQDELTELIN